MLRWNLAARRVLMVVCMAASAKVAAQPPNSALQSATVQAMAGRRGTVVVLDVKSGRILAASHLEVAARRVVAPGSSIKPFTLMALLQSGKVNAQTGLVCKRSVSIGGHKLDCTHPETAQPLDPAQALAYSCNSYFTTVASRLTPSELRSSLLQAGFGSRTVLVADDVAGAVALAQSPEQVQLQAIGEWGIRVTPLELLYAYRALALLQSKHDLKLDPLFAGLEQSVSYGMGHAAQPETSLKVAGKTGTAPSDEGEWTHAWFAGYAPAENPEIVLVVFLERGHGGADAAAAARPIFAAFADSKAQVAERGSGDAR